MGLSTLLRASPHMLHLWSYSCVSECQAAPPTPVLTLFVSSLKPIRLLDNEIFLTCKKLVYYPKTVNKYFFIGGLRGRENSLTLSYQYNQISGKCLFFFFCLT